MYVVVQHEIKDPSAAFARGEKLIKNEGAPAGVRGLQFYPSRDGAAVTCLWEAPSVAAIQDYVDATLGDYQLVISKKTRDFAERFTPRYALNAAGLIFEAKCCEAIAFFTIPNLQPRDQSGQKHGLA